MSGRAADRASCAPPSGRATDRGAQVLDCSELQRCTPHGKLSALIHVCTCSRHPKCPSQWWMAHMLLQQRVRLFFFGCQGGIGRDVGMAGNGWQLVSSQRGSHRLPHPTLAPTQCPLPIRMEGRSYRCLALGHRAIVCRDPFRCSHCLRPGHCAHGCTSAWRPLSSLLP